MVDTMAVAAVTSVPLPSSSSSTSATPLAAASGPPASGAEGPPAALLLPRLAARARCEARQSLYKLLHAAYAARAPSSTVLASDHHTRQAESYSNAEHKHVHVLENPGRLGVMMQDACTQASCMVKLGLPTVVRAALVQYNASACSIDLRPGRRPPV